MIIRIRRLFNFSTDEYLHPEIKRILIYPLRGGSAVEVERAKITPYGIKGDGDFCIAMKEKNKYIVVDLDKTDETARLHVAIKKAGKNQKAIEITNILTKNKLIQDYTESLSG